MKLKEVLCNTNILVLFFGFKLAMETREVSELSRSDNPYLSNVNKIKEIEELYYQDAEKKGLKRIFFSVMLRFLKLLANVEKTEWDQKTDKYCRFKKISDLEEIQLLKEQNLKFSKMLEELSSSLFGDNPNVKFFFEKTKLFNFISEEDFSGENKECPDWNELRACDQYYRSREDDKNNICEKGDESGEANKNDKVNEFVALYKLSISEALLLKKYYQLWSLANKEILCNDEVSIHDFLILRKYIGITSNNAKYSFFSLILIKLFELIESKGFL